MFNPHSMEERNMKKFGYVLAAVGAIAVAAPSIASAEAVVIKRGAHHHQMGARAEIPRTPGLRPAPRLAPSSR
jgi:hypothetical protein